MRRFLMVLFAVAAFGSAARAANPDLVHITYVASPFNMPLFIMRANGYIDDAFAKRGIKVDMPSITSGATQIQAMAAGAVDIASVLGDTSAILGGVNGIDIKIVAVFSRNPKAYAILVPANGPGGIEGLKGKNIAGPKGTTLQQLLAAALAAKGMKLSDVNYINMDQPTARAALLAHEVDAATLAGNDELVSLAAGYHVMLTGDGLIAPTSVVAVRGAFLRDHRDLVAAYLAAQQRALDFMKSQPEQALEIAAKDQKMSVADARQMLPWYDFSPVFTDQDVKNMQSTQAFMLSAGMIQNTVDIRAQLIDPSAFAVK